MSSEAKAKTASVWYGARATERKGEKGEDALQGVRAQVLYMYRESPRTVLSVGTAPLHVYHTESIDRTESARPKHEGKDRPSFRQPARAACLVWGMTRPTTASNRDATYLRARAAPVQLRVVASVRVEPTVPEPSCATCRPLPDGLSIVKVKILEQRSCKVNEFGDIMTAKRRRAEYRTEPNPSSRQRIAGACLTGRRICKLHYQRRRLFHSGYTR